MCLAAPACIELPREKEKNKRKEKKKGSVKRCVKARFYNASLLQLSVTTVKMRNKLLELSGREIKTN